MDDVFPDGHAEDTWRYMKEGREGGRKGGREGGREGGKEGGREEGREGWVFHNGGIALCKPSSDYQPPSPCLSLTLTVNPNLLFLLPLD
jgi:hypothetical protein